MITVGELGDEVGSFVRALRRDKLSPNTIASYQTALRQLAEFLSAHAYSTDIRRIEARHIDEWIGGLLERQSAAIAHNRFRAAQRFFNWYVDTDTSFTSPMRPMRPPKLPDYARVLEPDQLKDLVRACRGREFEDRRDMALVRVFVDTGARRAEIANLRYSPTDPADRDFNFRRGTVRIPGKCRPEGIISLDRNTAEALSDYVSARRGHPHAQLPWLWLGKAGRLTDSGVGRALRDRGIRAGIRDLHRLGHGLWFVQPAGQPAR
jgi:site-specific recombinase XerD